MAIKSYKPTTPSRRGMTVTDYSRCPGGAGKELVGTAEEECGS